MLKITLSLFIIGHFLGDFYLQSSKLAENKDKVFNKLIVHSLIYLFSMAIIIVPILGLSLLKWIILVSLLHFLVDWLKFYLNKKHIVSDRNQISLYFLDQLIHLVTILIVIMVINLSGQIIQYGNIFKSILDGFYIDVELTLIWILGIIIIIKPASITIRKILYQYQPTIFDKEEVGHPGAGSLIGILERLIILIMLSQNQYSAIGFILTAKSIARYNKLAEDLQFSEYYLLGTLLSVLLVIVTHILIVL